MWLIAHLVPLTNNLLIATGQYEKKYDEMGQIIENGNMIIMLEENMRIHF